MDISPGRSAFDTAYAAGRSQVVWTELPADIETPVSVMLKLGQERRFTALLESVQGGITRGRYSFIALEPDLVWRCNGAKAEICRDVREGALRYAPEALPALASLRALLKESRIDMPEHLPPNSAGLMGYMGYDTVRLAENIPNKNPDTLGIPDGMFMRPTVSVIFDNVDDVMTIVVPVYPKAGVSVDLAYAIAKSVLGQNPRLKQAIAAASETLAENAGKNTFLPYHPGAARYLREVGQTIPDKLVMA